ncbi:hypothetical protein EV215_0706 [Hypnocyclicus thermotrophus]|uniref:Uncharacterized protein n=1 Tax=Hypnocyclicus thermotrophus TaxID=1627895 RepID=A0AA46I6R9_9FUSO|nr:hypothetical protein [Hypnocyclicus thermotrophus]TDT72011.1 hypothetical protein EV215_0706 [Hypnocyclicus thermotrophus]
MGVLREETETLKKLKEKYLKKQQEKNKKNLAKKGVLITSCK